MENLKINFKEFILDNGFKILVLNKQCKFFNLILELKLEVHMKRTMKEDLVILLNICYLDQIVNLKTMK
ncbi:hypothetical protein SFB4_070G1 [Candidatus Arthromitus sp. SFB-4]|nr:hypothetical protein SFB4_070G1 [Candidatus Arthromitus sp. SFB-4]